MANSTVQERIYSAVEPTIYPPEAYISYYDTGYCMAHNVTYSHRVDMKDNLNYCSVPLTGEDAFLFMGLALLVASVCMGKLSAIWMLVAGGIFGIVNYEANLGRVSNSISLWLGIQPPDIFFYAFLPPLLTDAAMRLDWYIFKKVWPHMLVMAYALVIINACILTPFILYGMSFSSRGWDWVHGAVLAAIFAPTDAVSVTALLKAGGGPETMVVLMEGEALFNDASAVTLYTVFMAILEEHTGPDAVMPSVPSLIPSMLRDIVKLTAIGGGVGLGFAMVTTYVLKLLRWRGVHAYVEAVTTLTIAYLAFYVAQSPAEGSGVIAVVVFGIYGSATSRWGMLARDEASGVHMAVWDTLAFIANGLIFFWGGISSVNFLARSASSLGNTAWSYAAIPLIYIFMFSTRALTLIVFTPLFKLFGMGLSLPQITFATVAALRGALSLILIADFTIHSDFYTGTPVDEVNFDILLWTSAFVLLTLLVNAPMIAPIMKWTGLSKITAEKVRLRKRAAEEVRRFTQAALQELRRAGSEGEFLQGANWDAVAHYVDLTAIMDKLLPGGGGKAKRAWRWGLHTHPHQQQPEGGLPVGTKGFDEEGAGGAEGTHQEGSRAPSEAEAIQPGAGPAVSKRPPSSQGEFSPQALDASEDLDGPVLEVPYLQPQAPWLGRPPRPPRRRASSSDVKRADVELGHLQRTSLAPLREGGSVHGGSAAGSSPAPSPHHSLLPGVRSEGTEGDPGPPVAPAASGGAANGVPPAGPQRRRALHRAFVSAPDVVALSQGGEGQPRLPPPPPATPPPESVSGVEEEVVVTLFSKDDALGEKDFEARYLETMPSARSGDNGGAAPQRASSAPAPPHDLPAPTALPALGSHRDLLGRSQAKRAAHTQPPPHPVRQPTFSVALRDRRKEAGTEAVGTRQRAEDGASEAGDLEGSTPSDLRLRLLTGLQRYFHHKRLQGLLSLQSLRILHYTCEKRAEEIEHAPDSPLGLWEALDQEIRPSLLTRAEARVLAWLLRRFRSAPKAAQSILRGPASQASSLLRKHLGRAMLSACEVGVELYLGLSTAPQVQWVFASDQAPLWLLEEVEGELEAAYGFVVEREAEAPHQYQAIQSYRAAMAVLQQQRGFLAGLYTAGTLDEGDRDELLHGMDSKIRHLEIVGPVWRPPAPQSVLRGLPFMAGAPPELAATVIHGGTLREYQPGEVVWSSAAAAGPASQGSAGDGIFVVVSGVASRQWQPRGDSTAQAQERREGIGGLVGLLWALRVGGGGGPLAGDELVVAQGNGLGRGPLLFHLPQAVVDAVRRQALEGDGAAATLEAALLRAAAAHVVEYMEGDVTGAVHNYLAVHHPLSRKNAPAGEEQQQRQELSERVARYSTQVLMDILAGLPTAQVLRLEPGQQCSLHHHTVLLEGQLQPSGLPHEGIPAPAVLPRLAGQQRYFSFYAGPLGSLLGRETGEAYLAGPRGALLVFCGGSSSTD